MLVIEYIMYTKFRLHSSYHLGVILTHVIPLYCIACGYLLLFTINNVVYKQISTTSFFGWRISTKFHYYNMLFHFWVIDVEPEEGDDEWNSLS